MAKRAKASEPSEPEREAGRCHTHPGAPRLDGMVGICC
jgi:hypothetical protein